MEALTNLVTGPLEALTALVPASLVAAPTSPFDKDSLMMLVYNLFQGDSR
jgi:hypothetical protein